MKVNFEIFCSEAIILIQMEKSVGDDFQAKTFTDWHLENDTRCAKQTWFLLLPLLPMPPTTAASR